MGLSTEPFQKAGVFLTVDDLERIVMHAAERLLPDQPASNAHSELSAAEVAFLERAGVRPSDFTPIDQGPTSALAQTAADYAVLLAASLPPSEVAHRIGVDESRIRQRINHHTLYAVKDARGWRVPVFQLDATGHALLPGLERIIPHIHEAHLVEVARWFLSPQVDLEGPDDEPMSPRDWLVGLETAEELRLLDLTGLWPTRAGASMALSTGPHARTRRWSRAVYEAYPEMHGLWYGSSMDSMRGWAALFERAAHAMPAAPAVHRALADPPVRALLEQWAGELNYRLILYSTHATFPRFPSTSPF